MKMTPLASGTGVPAGAGLGQERMPTSRIAAAKAIAEGKEPLKIKESDTPVDEETLAKERAIKRIKMRTQVSPDRPTAEDAAPPVAETTQAVVENATADVVEPGKEANDATKPLSPAFAELARQRRSLQLEKKALAEERAKLESSKPNLEEYVLKSDLVSNPLKVFESGVSYDAMTQALLANPSAAGNPEIQELRREIKALKEGVDQTITGKEQQAEEAALSEMLDEAEQLAASSDDFELVRSKKAYDQVLTKIYDTYKKTGKLLQVSDVMREVESKLLENVKKDLELKKIKSIYSSQTPEPQQRAPQPQGMRTLTNRDGSQVPVSRRDRAMAAFRNQQ